MLHPLCTQTYLSYMLSGLTEHVDQKRDEKSCNSDDTEMYIYKEYL